jgi:hypothetical protein
MGGEGPDVEISLFYIGHVYIVAIVAMHVFRMGSRN